MSLRPILVASHPRSGTHVMIDFIRKAFPSTASWRLWGLPLSHLYLNIESLTSRRHPASDRWARRIIRRPDRPLMKTHFLPDFSESWIEEESGPLAREWRELAEAAHKVYVTRDPRAVMRSYKLFMSQFAPEYADMSLVDFCRSPHWTGRMDRMEWWERHVSGWLAEDGVIHVRYERLLAEPAAVAARLSAALGEEPRLSPSPLPKRVGSVWQSRLSRFASLAPESTAVLPKITEMPDPLAPDPEEARFFDERVNGLLERLENGLGSGRPG